MSEDFDKLSRTEQIAVLSQKPLLLLGDIEEEDRRLKNYMKFFFNVSFPDTCHPDCVGKCTPPFRVISDAFYARFPLIVLKGARGTGKGSRLTDPILTPEGWKTMGDMVPGSKVIDWDGNIVNVTHIHPLGKKKIYKVSFNDGTSTTVTGQHLWTVRTGDLISKGPRKGQKRRWVVKNTLELKKDLTYPRGDLKWRIPIVKAINFPEKNLPLDPYALGLILGDGSLMGSTPTYACHKDDSELVTYLNEALKTLHVSAKLVQGPKEINYCLSKIDSSLGNTNKLTEVFKSLELMGKNSYTKFIPKEYLFSSPEQRLSLLKGLFDTDAHCNIQKNKKASGGIEYTSASKDLSEGVTFLVQSLGGTSVVAIKYVDGNPYYRHYIKMPVCPFKLKRKVANWRVPTKYLVTRIITAIEEFSREEAQCITVDSPTSTYLTNDCIVTHNSVLVGTLSLLEQVNLNAEVLILGGSQTQSRKVFEYISQAGGRTQGMFWNAPNAPKALQDKKSELLESSRIVTGGLIKCLPASPTSVYGQRPSRLRVDEADVCDLELINGAIPCAHPIGNIREQILISSTHYDSGGTLSAFIDRAEKANKAAGKVVMPVYQFCYKDVLAENKGYLTVDQMARMKSMVSPEVWRRQFENGEPAAENTVFNLSDIEWMMDPELGVYDGAPGQECSIWLKSEEHPEGMPENTVDSFYTGADWGVKLDWTVFSVWGSNANPDGVDYLVYWYRPQRELGLKGMVEKYDQILCDYPGPAAHDATGMSQIVSEIVQNQSTPINFSNKKLVETLMNKFISCVQQRKLKMPKIKFLENELKYLTYEQAYGNRHLPDSMASLLMAWYARERIMRNFNIESFRW